MTPYGGFTRTGWILFAVMAVVWGMPYLFIKEALESYSPVAVVAGRTLIGGLVLLPFALRAGALKQGRGGAMRATASGRPRAIVLPGLRARAR